MPEFIYLLNKELFNSLASLTDHDTQVNYVYRKRKKASIVFFESYDRKKSHSISPAKIECSLIRHCHNLVEQSKEAAEKNPEKKERIIEGYGYFSSIAGLLTLRELRGRDVSELKAILKSKGIKWAD